MINNLIKELEQAECGSVELDLKIARALGVIPNDAKPSVTGVANWYSMEKHYGGIVPKYTRSLDATEDALPEGWKYIYMTTERQDNSGWEVLSSYNADGDYRYVVGVHKDLQLAMAIVVLKVHMEASN